MENLIKFIREIPNFPKKGILFKDITPLLENGNAFSDVISIFVKECPPDVDKIAAIESRGFIFGSALAYHLKKGFVPIRKSGKLPWEKVKVEYDLEYGTDIVEMHKDGIKKGEKVVLVDDLLATGGTALASCHLIEKCEGIVEKVLFLIELKELNGREKIKDYNIFSILKM